MNGKYGRSTFGLDNQGQSIQVNVGLFTPVQHVLEPEPEARVIDVQPESNV